MGSMSSPAKGVECITFNPFPSKPVAGLRVVRVEDIIVGVGENGAVYTTAAVKRKIHCCGHWRWSEALTEALDKLGLLTAEDKKAHADYLAAERARSEAISQLGDATRAAENPKSGVKLRHLQAMWNALDWRGQWEAERYKYRPAGVTKKPSPKL